MRPLASKRSLFHVRAVITSDTQDMPLWPVAFRLPCWMHTPSSPRAAEGMATRSMAALPLESATRESISATVSWSINWFHTSSSSQATSFIVAKVSVTSEPWVKSETAGASAGVSYQSVSSSAIISSVASTT